MIDSLIGQGINVRHACRVLGVSESGYYAWKDRPDPPRTLRRIWLAGEIADVHKASGGTYGYMRVTAELRHGREIVVGHNTVGKIMSELGIKGLPTRRLPKGARMAQVTSLDLVRRVCRRDGPNQLWMTDITEHPTREGKVYCCVVLDAFSRLVVGWLVDSTQTTVLVTNALGMATSRRDGQFDLYDVRVNGGFASQNQPPPAPPCEGESCQSPPHSPTHPTPASAVFEGGGNLAPRARCAKGRKRVVQKGKARCLKSKKQRRAKRHHERAKRGW
ncbi:MAG TPA: IS3 family transposase [Solirubrobacterales bacterium]|nr:IS3 family transposase [Solirubrobacterales bacterium]